MLVAMVLLLPQVNTPAVLSPAVRILAYAVVFIPVPLLLHGFLVESGDYATSRLLTLGAVSVAVGFLSALVARPGYLADGPGLLVPLTLCVADLARIFAASCVGISLARYVTSVGTVLIVVAAVA
jgi:hypothetical protein